MLSLFSRNRVAHLFLGVLFLWSLLPPIASSGSADVNRLEQREYFSQGQASSLPVLADHRGKHSADQQLNTLARTPQDDFEAFERTARADRATVTRTITPFPVHVVYTQHTSSDL